MQNYLSLIQHKGHKFRRFSTEQINDSIPPIPPFSQPVSKIPEPVDAINILSSFILFPRLAHNYQVAYLMAKI